jgi:hypothetical protein
MKRYTGQNELTALSTGVARKQPICQEVYDAYVFDLRVEASQFSKFAFVSHEGRSFWARSLVIFPEGGGPARQGSFCVAFKEGTTTVEEAFAFYGKASDRTYFGHLPDDFEQIETGGFAELQADDLDDSTPSWRM